MQLVQKLGPSVRLSTELKLASVQSRPSESLPESELIPGLPDDIALSCLLRLPLRSHSGCRSVCRRWYRLFSDQGEFFTRRKEMGIRSPLLFVFALHKATGKIQWHVLDLTHLSWHTIPAMPWPEKACPDRFRSVSVAGDGSIFVGDLDCLLKFEVRKNKWTRTTNMITSRSCFASGVIDGIVYVAGGNGSDGSELSSAESMGPKTGSWHLVANMGSSMAAYDAAVLDGKLLVTEGWFWPFCVVPRGQIYDPKNNSWECMATGLREGWTGSSAVIYGRLFVVSEHERTKLKVYDARRDTWETVQGPALPERICKPFAVNCCDNRIYVVGRNLDVVVGCILQLNGTENPTFSVQWQVVKALKGFDDMTPSSAHVLFA